MQFIAMTLIRAYQRCPSPYKGYHCALRVHLETASCSSHALRTIERCGVQRGWQLTRRRTALCSTLVRQLHREAAAGRGHSPLRARAGFCYADCEGSVCEIVDCSTGEAASGACHTLDFCSFSDGCGDNGEQSRRPPTSENSARGERQLNIRRANRRAKYDANKRVSQNQEIPPSGDD